MDDLAQACAAPRLPPELRIQVFSHLLRYEGELQRRTTLTAESYKKGEPESDEVEPSAAATRLRPIDTSLFVLSKTLHEEVLDCFYHVNTFKIHYNQLCICQAKFRFPAFDRKRVKDLHIYDFDPRDDVRVCSMCERAGLGLISFLTDLPKLESARVSFEDYIRADDFVKAARMEPSLEFAATEFGAFSLLTSRLRVDLDLPLMHLAWRRLADGHGDGDEHSNIPLPGGEETIRHGLEYLQFEAEDWKRVPLCIRPYFMEEQRDGLRVSCLRLKSLPSSNEAILNFTLALADVFGDLFSVGTECIEWEYLDGIVDAVRWDFKEACAD